MNKTNILKFVTNGVVTVGVGRIANSIIANNISPEKASHKVEVIAGTVVLCGIVKDASRTYTDAKIDSYIAAWNKIKNRVEEPAEVKE